MLRKLLRYSLMVSLSGVILLGLLLIFLQLTWTKEKMGGLLFQMAERQGVRLTIDSIQGEPPLKWTFRGVRATLADGSSADLHTVRLRIAILPLLRGEIGISYLELDGMQIKYLPSPLSKPASFSWPWSVSIRSLKADDIHIENAATGRSGTYSLRGKGRLSRKGRSFRLQAHIASPLLVADASVNGSHRAKHAAGEVHAEIKSKEALEPFAPLPFNVVGVADLHLQGPWKAWNLFFFPKKDELFLQPLEGRIKLSLQNIDLPELAGLDSSGSIQAAFSLFADRSVDISAASLKSNLLCLKGEGKIGPDFLPSAFSISYLIPHLSRIVPDMSGIVGGDAVLTEDTVKVTVSSDKISLGGAAYTSLAGTAEARRQQDLWAGSLAIQAENPVFPIAIQSALSCVTKQYFSLTNLSLKGPETAAVGDLRYDISEKKIEGGITLQATDLSRFAAIFPGSSLKGSLGAKIDFAGHEVPFYLLGKNVQFYELLSKELSVQGTLTDLFAAPKGDITFTGKTFYLGPFFFDQMTLGAKSENERWPFTFMAMGQWKTPLNIEARGSLALSPSLIDFQLDHLSGRILQKNLSIEKPFSVQKSGENLLVTEGKLFLAEGYLMGALDVSSKNLKINLKAEHFPIDLFALATTRFTLSGACALNVAIEGSLDDLHGHANLLLERGNVLQSGKQTPILTKGSLQANIENKVAQIHSHLVASGDQFFDLSLTLPLLGHMIDPEKPLAGEITAEGHLEEIFDFINIGSHRTTGNLSLHLLLSHTLSSPDLHGTFSLQKGSYENYFTGMNLSDISLEGHGEHSNLFITALSAKDEGEGTLQAQGKIAIAPEFHFSLDTKIHRLQILDIPWIVTHATGDATLSGTASSAGVKGNLTISRADLRIPDQLPVDLPLLPITYIHRPAHLKNSVLSLEPSYPFYYDLQLDAKETIHLTGRGLEAELAGNLHVNGRNLSVETKGTLHLVKGKFHFGGKEFLLTQGDISFSENASHLNLTATLNLPDVTVYALLRGPLNAPVLTFQSTPALPTSSVLARILFNKEVSELSAPQIVQLADSIVSLSGGAAPSVLESIRKSIGVDRLTIVSGESDNIAVHIGKYLAEGVMITLSQSAESSQVIVEVELKGGFVLQAETQEDDQGKFSLKWNMNY